MNTRPLLLCTPLAFGLLAFAPEAVAVDVTRQEYPNAGAFCQGALPAFAGTLRTRPLAVVNEGSEPAFLTCSFAGGVDSRFLEVMAVVINGGDTTQTVSCTLVDGFQDSTVDADYVPKSAQVAAGGRAYLTYTPPDIPAATYITNPNLSCSLPPGTGMTYIGLRYLESVGN